MVHTFGYYNFQLIVYTYVSWNITIHTIFRKWHESLVI